MQSDRFQIRYIRSKFWLIFWILIFFPIGLVLLLNHTELVFGERVFKIEYNGSRFWLFFWAMVFFPVMVLLFLFNGSFLRENPAHRMV